MSPSLLPVLLFFLGLPLFLLLVIIVGVVGPLSLLEISACGASLSPFSSSVSPHLVSLLLFSFSTFVFSLLKSSSSTFISSLILSASSILVISGCGASLSPFSPSLFVPLLSSLSSFSSTIFSSLLISSSTAFVIFLSPFFDADLVSLTKPSVSGKGGVQIASEKVSLRIDSKSPSLLSSFSSIRSCESAPSSCSSSEKSASRLVSLFLVSN
mmetsp:Transcript_12843/g.27755  ORF Transcript_12843/g.27755 Transcript_12843/m.27755 type:complete len:212 (-) Transcript_12843:124-759(-)